MLLKKFNFEDLDGIKSAIAAINAIGFSEELLNDKAIIGDKKAYYKNFIIANETYEHVRDQLRKDDELIEWMMYAPEHDSARSKQLEEAIGPLNRSVLYVITPEDEMFIENPINIEEA